LSKLFRYRDNADKLAEIYYENIEELSELKKRFPNWKDFVDIYISAEVKRQLISKGIPL